MPPRIVIRRRSAPPTPIVVPILTSLLLVLVAGVAAPSSVTDTPIPPHRLLELDRAADSLYAAGDLEGGIRALEELNAAAPGRPEVLIRLAGGYRGQGRHAEADALLREQIDAGFVGKDRAWLRLARSAATAGLRDSALACLRRALDEGFHERPSLKSHEDFAALRDDPRFRRLAGFPADPDADRAAGWREDLAFLLEEARRLHADPRRPAESPAFAADLEALAGRTRDLDDVAMAMEAQKLLVRHLADGHTVLYPMSTERVDFGGLLPVRPWFFADGLFIVNAREGHEPLIGAEIVAIGGRSAAELRRGLHDVVSRDNDQGIEMIGPFYLAMPAALRALGAATSLERATLTVRDAAGTREVTLATVPFTMPERRLPPFPGAPVPTWLSRNHATYGHEALPAMSAVYAQLNQVRDPEGEPTLEAWATTLRGELERTGARNLILDLRHNNGGNNFLTWPFVRLVSWHEMNDARHRTFVITGPGVFSACQNLVNHLERATNAIFIGQPAASRPNFTGEDTWVELPWSGIRLSISSRWWQDSFPTDGRTYVPVSMPVPLTSADWKAGRDPVMEELAAYLARNPG
jgi:tetratricopeptide (TPR) repeat protein